MGEGFSLPNGAQNLKWYMVKFMWSDFKVETAWTLALGLALEWRETLLWLKDVAQKRLALDASDVPITPMELAQALARSPSMEVTFCSTQSCQNKRWTTPYCSNLKQLVGKAQKRYIMIYIYI